MTLNDNFLFFHHACVNIKIAEWINKLINEQTNKQIHTFAHKHIHKDKGVNRFTERGKDAKEK